MTATNARQMLVREDTAPYPGALHAAYVVALLFIVWATSYLDRQVVAVLVPALKSDLGLSDTQISLLQGISFASCFALASIPLGHLADRTNRRNLILIGLVSWSLATIACGFASTFWQLFAGRMAVGLGEACVAPAVVSMLADYFPPRQRGRAVGLVQSGTAIGNALSLFVGGYILTAHAANALPWAPAGWSGWQLVFVVVGLPGLIVAPFILSLREPVRRLAPQHAEPGTAPKLITMFKAHAAPLIVIGVINSCVSIYSIAISAWAPTVLMRNHGFTPAHTGEVMAIILILGSFLGAAVSGFLSDALARWRPADGRSLCPVLLMPVILPLLVVLGLTTRSDVTVGVIGLLAFSNALLAYNLYPLLQEITPNQLRGKMVGLSLLVTQLVGMSIGPTAVGVLNDYVFRDEMMLQKSLGIVCVAAGLVVLGLGIIVPRLYRTITREDGGSDGA